MGGHASSTSPWPSPLPGLPHPSGAQRLASPTHPPRQRLSSPLVCRKSRAAATSRTTRLASRSLKCFRFWMWARMEPGEQRGHTGMLFQPLLGITSQKPVSTSLRWGHRLIHHERSSTKGGSWYRGGTSTKLDGTEWNCCLLYLFMTSTEKSEGNYLNHQKIWVPLGQIWLLKLGRAKVNLYRVGGLSVGTFPSL